MVSPLYESVCAVSGSFSVRNFSHSIRTEMISVLYLYESANCVPPGIASVQNISDKFHTEMFSPLYEQHLLWYEYVHALSGIFSVRNFSHNICIEMFFPLYESVRVVS